MKREYSKNRVEITPERREEIDKESRFDWSGYHFLVELCNNFLEEEPETWNDYGNLVKRIDEIVSLLEANKKIIENTRAATIWINKNGSEEFNIEANPDYIIDGDTDIAIWEEKQYINDLIKQFTNRVKELNSYMVIKPLTEKELKIIEDQNAIEEKLVSYRDYLKSFTDNNNNFQFSENWNDFNVGKEELLTDYRIWIFEEDWNLVFKTKYWNVEHPEVISIKNAKELEVTIDWLITEIEKQNIKKQ